MKKILICAFAACLSLCLAACGGSSDTPSGSNSGSTEPAGKADPTPEPAAPAVFSEADYGMYYLIGIAGAEYEEKYAKDILDATAQSMREQDSFLRFEVGDTPIMYWQGTPYEFTVEPGKDGNAVKLVDEATMQSLFGKMTMTISVDGGILTFRDTEGNQIYTFSREA